MATLSAASSLRSAYLRFFSKPVGERVLYRAIHKYRVVHKRPIKHIIELGIGRGRARKVMEMVRRHNRDELVRYTGIDLFEARRDDVPGMTLKEAHVWSKTLGVRTELVPGDACTALSRTANRLKDTDLLIISGGQDENAMRRAWFFVPRMLHKDSLVFVKMQDGSPDGKFHRVSLATVESLAQKEQARRKAA